MKKAPLDPAVNRPEPPEDLSEREAKAWHSVCDDLHRAGTLASIDAKLIELYARDWSLLCRIDDQLDKEPLSYPTESGRLYVHPLLGNRTSLSKSVSQTLSKLGLTPLARGAQSKVTPPAASVRTKIKRGDI